MVTISQFSVFEKVEHWASLFFTQISTIYSRADYLKNDAGDLQTNLQLFTIAKTNYPIFALLILH